jgi:hypothetical protein
MNTAELRKEIPFTWKIQTVTKDGAKASVVAYIDSRAVMNLLDEVAGPENWQNKFHFDNGKLICGIGIFNGKEWIWKHDVGTESDYEKEKGQFSDAFKRAAVHWGIGRFLYDLDIEWVAVNSYKRPIDEKGNQIKDLTEYIEQRRKVKYGNQKT